jgi:hypothetical protein
MNNLCATRATKLVTRPSRSAESTAMSKAV